MLPVKIASGLAKSGFVNYFFRGGFFLALASATYLIVKKIVNKIRRGTAIQSYGDTTSQAGLSASYANQLYQAMVRSNGWFNAIVGDGTDHNAMYSTASEMQKNRVPFSAVSKSFKAIHNKDLLEMINSELDSQQLLRFNSILENGLAGIRLEDHYILTHSPTYVYNEALRPIQTVKEGTKLGIHIESVIYGDGRKFDGFDFNGAMRYVESTYANLIKI